MTAASDDINRQTTPSASAAQSDAARVLTLFGKMLTFTRVKLETSDINKISEYLGTILSNKTSQIPVVIDSEIEQDLPALVDLFWSWGLQPIGVVSGALDQAAKELRLAIFPSEGKRIERIRPTKKVTVLATNKNDDLDNLTNSNAPQTLNTDESSAYEIASELSEGDKTKNLIYEQMLRSGQSINHVGGDLILTNSVNNGAEAISDNCLHIYGRAQGRLVAGATGDKEAHIFCQGFNPSLVSVAGTYCLNDNIPEEFIDKPVQVSFKEGEGLVFKLMNNG